MKIEELNRQLCLFAKTNGVIIRKETGRFKSGFCLVNDSKLIILNKMASEEYQSKIIAIGITFFEIETGKCKPEIAKFIEKECDNADLAAFQIDLDITQNALKEQN